MSTTTETESKRYNGWTNYETWCVALWIGNEEGSQRYWAEKADHARNWCDGDEDKASQLLAEELKGEFEESGHAIIEIAKATSSVWADLLGGAMSEVNWREIAANKLEAAV